MGTTARVVGSVISNFDIPILSSSLFSTATHSFSTISLPKTPPLPSTSNKLKHTSCSSKTSSSMASPLQVNAVTGYEETSSSGVIGANDLLIVGPGILGRLVANQWRKEHEKCEITGQTVTADHHEELLNLGIVPCLKGTKLPRKYPFVIFCAPPYQTSDYPGDVREAASYWNGEGSFLFTSSSAPYDRYDNGYCNEDSPVVPIGRSPRTDVLLKAEKEVIAAGGCVLRLAGLYKEDRGAHVYWLEKGTVDARPDHVLNFIHYEDAASLSIAILKKKLRSQIFLGCDNHPLSRQGVMDIIEKSGKFSKKFGGFTGTNDPLGKKLDNSKTRKEIGWEPKYQSYAHFLGVYE
ncbi:uncharacterized protein LOC108200058 [Daucus carota subsp. sativus]|uniref:uncharacterized protein LOC108200058 n=1 Tax=Daucus carota subsp. sativus TaxID=79200 RepID=UPI0007EF6971|nr:PREDICTED: uncharacterized protein LOC108200058 [Daucus carota subsp. sativus]